MIKKIGLLTVGRSDFYRYIPILDSLKKIESVDFKLIVSGGHLLRDFGYTWKEVAKSGYPFYKTPIIKKISKQSKLIGNMIARDTIAINKILKNYNPDLIVLLGDRYELLSGATAALSFSIPIVHIHGGAITEGAIDDLIRHSISKLSHYHLVSNPKYAERIKQLGEEKWRVKVVGAPGLDHIKKNCKYNIFELSKILKINLNKGFILVSFHPVTQELENTEYYIKQLIKSLKKETLNCVLTYPNNDPGSEVIINHLTKFNREFSNKTVLSKNLGVEVFTSLMFHAKLFVGNSSSGIVESPSLCLPTVNIGTRQKGKIKSKNIIDTNYSAKDISNGINKAKSMYFKNKIKNVKNPYGDGKSGKRIAKILKKLIIDKKLLKKKFIDYE